MYACMNRDMGASMDASIDRWIHRNIISRRAAGLCCRLGGDNLSELSVN